MKITIEIPDHKPLGAEMGTAKVRFSIEADGRRSTFESYVNEWPPVQLTVNETRPVPPIEWDGRGLDFSLTRMQTWKIAGAGYVLGPITVEEL